MIQDNLLVIGLLLTFALLSWFVYKSLNSSSEVVEDEYDTETELIEVLSLDETFIENKQTNKNEQESKKLSEKLKNVRPTIVLDTETPVQPSTSKPVTKNIRVNKKIKN